MPWTWLTRGQEILSSSGYDLHYFGSSSNKWAERPDIQMHGMITAVACRFTVVFLNYEDAFIKDIGEESDYGIFTQGLVIAPTLLRPKAVGRVTLWKDGKSGLNSNQNDPFIMYEAFGMDEDVDRIIEGIRWFQRIMTPPTMVVYAPTLLHVRSLALALGENMDAYLREYVKRFGFVVYYPTGTCRMGKVGEEGTLVDPTLRVQGVKGLRVSNASVMPDIQWEHAGTDSSGGGSNVTFGGEVVRQDGKEMIQDV